MDIRNILSLSAVLLVAGAIGYYWEGTHDTVNTLTRPDQARNPDYIATGISSLQTDEQGVVTRRMEAGKLKHYTLPADHAEIDAPRITLVETHQPNWLVTSDQGESIENNSHLLLEKNVVAKRLANTPRDTMQLNTELLHVYPDKEAASTPEAFTMTSSQGQATAKGMDASMKTGIINLHSEVKGVYVPAH